MRKALLFCCVLLLLAETGVADVSYRRFRMGSWEMRAENCGETYQVFVSDELDHLLPGFPGVMWEAARNEGAEEEEIEILKKLFDEGRKLALQKPWLQNPPLNLPRSYLKMQTEYAPKFLEYCTRAYLED